MNKTTCNYCYFYSRCSRQGLPLANRCNDWRPYVVPRRALRALAQDFATKANDYARHVYSDYDRTALLKLIFQLQETVEFNMSTMENSGELPESEKENYRYYEFMKSHCKDNRFSG